jgi:glycosyltransferase involved in cell wall biosynthesis
LASLRGQSYQNIEIIVVDDGSSEDIGGIVEREDDGRIKYLRHKANQGVSAARNTGIKAATGRFIGFLDSDDEWLPTKVERQIEALAKDDRNKVCYCFTEVFSDEVGRVIDAHSFAKQGDILHYALIGNGVERGWTGLCVLVIELMLPREELLRVGLFNERYRSHEDWDFLIRLAARYGFACVPEILVRGHKHSRGHITNNPKDVVDTRRSMFQSHRDLYLADRPAAAAFFLDLAYYQGLMGRRGDALLSLSRSIAFQPMSKAPYLRSALVLMNRQMPPRTNF